MKIDEIKRDVLLGFRPARGACLALAVACERAGIEEIEEISRGELALIHRGQATLAEVLDAKARRLSWCSWHAAFEDASRFKDGRADCVDGTLERDRDRKARARSR